jgi:fimbrial isopeptide formation D2 family protein/LPXTG-motif cell wall-anchored protein
MKRLKKTLAFALALILALAMSTTVFATEGDGGDKTYSITITGAPSGHTYEAYQIFTGTVSGTKKDGYTLSNVKWGSGVTAVDSVSISELTAADEAAKLTNEAAVKDYSQKVELAEATAASVPTTDANGTVYTISGLTAGYYLVKDQEDVTLEKGDAYTRYIVEVVGEDVTAQAKASTTTSEKKVKDVNDSNNDTDGWEDSADYDIGDNVPFRLTATITQNYDDYASYYLAFHDTFFKGLSFNDDVTVYVQNGEADPVQITGNFTVDKTDTSFDVVFENLKSIDAVQAESTIIVYYTARLNEEANLGEAGNTNTMYVEYSNNPNVTGEGNPSTGTTPEDTVIVFTYKVEINKVDKNGDPLEGAEFILYKKDASLTENTSDYTVGSDFYKKIDYVEINEDKPTTFTFYGIDDGDYILHEAETPTGYNSISDIVFSVAATHSLLSEAPELTALSGNKTSGEIDSFSLLENKSGLTTDVTNYKGSTLPSTGGTGRVLLYVVGAILVAGVGVILVSKKRAQQ